MDTYPLSTWPIVVIFRNWVPSSSIAKNFCAELSSQELYNKEIMKTEATS